MKLTFKILKLSAILIFTVSIILFTASLLLQDKVAGIIIKSINKNISTPFEVGTIKLSFLRKFPKASLELKDVFVHSSSGFSSSAFKGINTDTLFSARFVSIEFRITDIIKGIYTIEKVGAREGKINLYTDTAGIVNYDISIKKGSPSPDNFTLNLDKIYLNNIKTYYRNLATNLGTSGVIKTGLFKSRISGDEIDFTADADMDINSFQLYTTKFSKHITAGIELSLKSSKGVILIKKGLVTVENYDFTASGTISSENLLDINLQGHNIDIVKIRNYLPEKYFNLVSEYKPSGILIIESRIKGTLSRTSNPHIEINCLLKDGHISYGKSNLSINNLSFAGYFSNGKRNCPETSILTVKDLKANLGSALYTGEIKLDGFVHPRIDLQLKGKIFPAELKEFFDIQNISAAQGSVDMDLIFSCSIDRERKYSFNDLTDMKPKAILNFNSFCIGLKKEKLLLNQVNGKLEVSDNIRAENFQLTFKKQKIIINGKFEYLPEWLEGRPVKMIATGDIYCSRILPELFINDFFPDSSSTKKTAFSLPDDVFLDINFKFDTLDYKTFSSLGFSGNLNYKPRLLTFKSLKMYALSGNIYGDGFLVQNSKKGVIAKGSFNVTNIDVNKTFSSFYNFGQSFLKAENIKGFLSGSLSLLLPMDSMLIPQIKTLTAEGKYLIINGALINFDPVKELSDFIELSELENISFERLENDFFIRNNFLYIPQMDVKSSAADLTVNGKHSFDNEYEYHVKLLLSEILSKKRKKNKSNMTEFGVVEDDGLGRTSLLLKITGKGEVIKVGYDLKAASTQVKNNIKNERQTLKSILNQEYGWFKNDSTPVKNPAAKKSRFKISWEEQDSTKIITAPPATKKESDVKNYFKKK